VQYASKVSMNELKLYQESILDKKIKETCITIKVMKDEFDREIEDILKYQESLEEKVT